MPGRDGKRWENHQIVCTVKASLALLQLLGTTLMGILRVGGESGRERREDGGEREREIERTEVKALSHLDVLASVWQGLKMCVKRWSTLNY